LREFQPRKNITRILKGTEEWASDETRAHQMNCSRGSGGDLAVFVDFHSWKNWKNKVVQARI
jgi:hypothetical protein